MTMPSGRSHEVVEVERWPSEVPLLLLCVLFSLAVYLVLLFTVIGLIYAACFAVFFFVAHAALMAHIRGSAVRLGPRQFPDLHRRVDEIAYQIGMEEVPAAYLMQAGGALNAFATRFLGLNVIVLYSELLEACGDNQAARDMIIAHELGHIRAGHLRFRWLIAPASLIPFLGTALSQAREYTCDRYGLVGAGERSGALMGLTILAAGGRHAPRVSQQELARQQEDLNTGWLTIGEWLSTHPPGAGARGRPPTPLRRPGPGRHHGGFPGVCRPRRRGLCRPQAPQRHEGTAAPVADSPALRRGDGEPRG